MAGSIAYIAALSIFPLLLGVIALLGLVLPSATVQDEIFKFATQYFPGSIELFEENIRNVIELRGTLGIFSIFGLLWAGSAIFSVLGRVFNKAWGVTVYRPYYVRKIRDLSLALATSVIFLLSMAATAISSIVPLMNILVLGASGVIIIRVLGFILIFAMIGLIYRFMPNTRNHWRHVWLGAFIAAILFELARTIFAIYLQNFASYDMVYGSIALVIILLVWIYISAFIVILGAEIAAEYKIIHQEPERY